MSTTKVINELIDSASEVLSGNPADVVGATLANLTAMFLAGHVLYGDDVIENLLQLHIETTRKLLPIYLERVMENMNDQPTALPS